MASGIAPLALLKADYRQATESLLNSQDISYNTQRKGVSYHTGFRYIQSSLWPSVSEIPGFRFARRFFPPGANGPGQKKRWML